MMQPLTDKLLSIIESLNRAKIAFSLAVTRDNCITILVAVPGERWEIDIFHNGDVNVEVFRSSGEMIAEQQLPAMIANHAD